MSEEQKEGLRDAVYKRLYHVERVVKLLAKKDDINIADEAEVVLLTLRKAMQDIDELFEFTSLHCGKIVLTGIAKEDRYIAAEFQPVEKQAA